MAERAKFTQLPGAVQFSARTAAIAGGSAGIMAVFGNATGATFDVVSGAFIPDTAITGTATNNLALALQNRGAAGTGTTAVTSTITFIGGVDAAQADQKAFTVSTTAANLLIANGDTVALVKSENGSGMALPAGMVVLTGKFV